MINVVEVWCLFFVGFSPPHFFRAIIVKCVTKLFVVVCFGFNVDR